MDRTNVSRHTHELMLAYARRTDFAQLSPVRVTLNLILAPSD